MPTAGTGFDIGVIACRMGAVIPIAGGVLGNCRGLLDVNGRRYGCGDDCCGIAVAIAAIIRVVVT